MKTSLADLLQKPLLRHAFDPHERGSNLSGDRDRQGTVDHGQNHAHCVQTHHSSPSSASGECIKMEPAQSHKNQVDPEDRLQPRSDGPKPPQSQEAGVCLTFQLPYLSFGKRMIKVFPNLNITNAHREFMVLYEFDYRLTEFSLITYLTQKRRAFLSEVDLYAETDSGSPEDVEASQYLILANLISRPRLRGFYRPLNSYYAVNCLLYHDPQPAKTLKTSFLQSLQQQSLLNMRFAAEKREMAATLKQKMLSLTTGNFKLSIVCRHESPLIGKIFGSGLQKYMLPRSQILTTTGKQGSSGVNKYSNLPDFAFKTYTDDMINSLIYMYLRQFENVYTLEDARQKRIFLPPVFLTLLLEITRYELHVMSRLGVDPTVTLETTTNRSTVEAHEISAMLDSILARTNPSDIDPACTVNYSYLFKTDSFAESGSAEAREALETLIESHPGFTERHKALLYQAELGLKLIEYILKNTGYENNLHFEQRLYDQVHIQYPIELTTQPVSIQHGRLKNYQLDGVKFLVSLYRSSNANLQDLQTGTGSSGCLLADDMGCGKTAQSIAFLAYLSDNRISTGMHLIISPLAVSDSWATEFQTWFPNFSILLYKGDQEQRAKYRRHILTLSKGNISVLTDYGGPAIKDKDSRAASGSAGYSSGDSGKSTNQILSNINAIVTTYEYAIKDRSFFRQIDFDVVIVDEASRVKNARGKLIDVLKKSINCRFRILLSGTPIQNNLRELFTLLGLIHPAVFCDYDRFESIFGQVFSLAHTGRNSDLHHTHRGYHGFRRRASTDSAQLEVSDVRTGASPSLSSVQMQSMQSISTTTSQAVGRRSKRQCGSTAVTFADDLGEDELDSSYSYSNKDSSEDENDNDSELSRVSSVPTEMMVPIGSTASLIGAKTASSLPELTQDLPQNAPITKDNIAEVAIQLAENIDKISGLTNSQKTFIVERLHGILKPFLLRRVKTEVLAQLPPKEEIIIRVPLSAFQLFFYNLAIANGRAMTNPDLASSLPANFIRNLDIYLRCVCNHPFTALEHDKLQLLYNFYLMKAKSFSARHKAENTDFYRQYGGAKEEASKDATASMPPNNFNVLENMYVNDQIWRVSGKLELLDNILAKLHKTSHRVLIFSQFKKVLDVLSSYLHYRQYKFVRFDGSVKDVDRNSMIRGYNREDSKDFVFLLSTRAASHGLNLQTADTVIIFDCDYNGTYDQQAQDRCYRLGQVNPVKVFKLYSNTAIESKMLSVATSKLSLATIVMDAGTYTTNAGDKTDGTAGATVAGGGARKKTKMSTQEYILEVLSANSVVPDDVHIPTSEEINRYLARNDMEFQAFQMHDIETSLYWRKRNFDEDVPRLDPEIPSVFSEQKDQIYEEMREMNLLEDKQEVVMPNMQIPSAESGGKRSHSAGADSDSTTSDYDEDDSLDEGLLASETDTGGSQQRKLAPKVLKKTQSIKKSMSRSLTAQDLSESAVFSLCMQVDKSLRDDPAFRNSIVLSSTIIQKTSVVLTPVVDTPIACFLIDHGHSSGVLFLVSTMVGMADLLRREDAYNNLGACVTQYVSSNLSGLFACFSRQSLVKQSAESVSLAQHLSSLVMAPGFSSPGNAGSGSWDSYLFLTGSESILQTAYTFPLAQQGHPLSTYQLLFTKAALFIMALKLERDVFHNDLLSYLTTDVTTAKKYTGISYSSLLFYFSSGLAVAVEEQSLCAPDLLYSKPSSESAVLNESADTTSLFLRSDRAYTDVYIKLESLPQLSGGIDVIRRGYAWYNGLSQSQRDQQPSYLQYLCNVIDHCRVGAASQDQLDPLPIYVRITINTERLRYLYSSARSSGVTTDVLRLLYATVSFHLRIMAIFNYLIHLIDPLCAHPSEDSVDVSSTVAGDSEPESGKEDSSKALLTYRILSQFWILPSKTELPSYYHAIPYPRSLAYIYYKLITLSYLSLHEFVADMRQSFKNCLQFNERSSAFCEHAKVCNELTFQQISQHFQYCNASSVISWFTAYERRLSVVKKGYTLLSTFVGCGIYELLSLPVTEGPGSFHFEMDGEKCKGLILSYGSGADMAGLCAYDILRYAIAAAKEGESGTGSTVTYPDASVRHVKK